jgi:hypothetical protein
MSKKTIAETDPLFHAVQGWKTGLVTGREVGWFENLFETKESVYPYINIAQPDAHALLFKKSLLQTWVPVFAKHLKITAILKSIIGVDILNLGGEKGPGLIEDLAKILIEDKESAKKLEERVEDVTTQIEKGGRSFRGIAYPLTNSSTLATLARWSDPANGALIAIEGILNHVDALTPYNSALGKTLRAVGASWAIADFPYFALTSTNKNFSGDSVYAINIAPEVELTLKGVPFDRTLGWYPYVRIFGAYRDVISAKAPKMRGIDFAWAELRLPTHYDRLPEKLNALLNPVSSADATPGKDKPRFPFDFNRESDVWLLLNAIGLAYAAESLSYEDCRDDLKSIAEDAVLRVKHLPVPLARFFGK